MSYGDNKTLAMAQSEAITKQYFAKPVHDDEPNGPMEIGESSVPLEHPVSKTLAAMAMTFEERNKVYGNSADKVGKVMAVLFPDGYVCRSEADHRMMDHFNRVIAKLVRFVNSDLHHKDSIHDLAVYAAMCEVEVDNHHINTLPESF